VIEQTSEAIRDRRARIQKMAAEGATSQEIAEVMNISERTVERHRTASGMKSPRRDYRINTTGEYCPVCNRRVGATTLRYKAHKTIPAGDDLCSNSLMPLQVVEGTPQTHDRRCRQVALLAASIQDENPLHVDRYLTGLSAHEVQAIAMYALAAIDLDRTQRELWPDWTELLEVGA